MSKLLRIHFICSKTIIRNAKLKLLQLQHQKTENPLLWILGVLGALMTAFYMFRLYFLVFNGKYKGDEKTEQHIHESPKVMWIPLIILAILAIAGGWIGLPAFTGAQHWLKIYLSPVFSASSQILLNVSPFPVSEEILLILTSVVGVLISIVFAWFIYGKTNKTKQSKTPALFKIFEARFWMDEIYAFLFVKPLIWLSDTFYRIVEVKWLDGIVNGVGTLVVRTGDKLKYIQNGYTEFYVFMMVLGIIVLILMNLIKKLKKLLKTHSKNTLGSPYVWISPTSAT